jgi:hypothetical protein
LLGTKITAGINRIRGKGDKKDRSEDPEFIRKRISPFDLSKPFV